MTKIQAYCVGRLQTSGADKLIATEFTLGRGVSRNRIMSGVGQWDRSRGHVVAAVQTIYRINHYGRVSGGPHHCILLLESCLRCCCRIHGLLGDSVVETADESEKLLYKKGPLWGKCSVILYRLGRIMFLCYT